MIFSYNWLKEYIKKIPKPEKLVEILTRRSFEVGEIKKIGKDYILDIDVLANRGPDCFSHIGVAREIAAITDAKIKDRKTKIKEDKKVKTDDFMGLEIENKNDCRRYTAKVVFDVKVKESSKWMQEKLRACGLRPINNVVDAANYAMLETGQPLHAFDFDKIEGGKQGAKKKIIVRRAKRGEKIITLENEKHDLNENILIIADQKSPLAVAGIKGGKKAEITSNTKKIILESANFNSRVIRKSSREVFLKTDASWRFEHSIDPNLTEAAINRTAELIGAKNARGLADFYPEKEKPRRVKFNPARVEKLLGLKISEKEIKMILNRLGFNYNKNNGYVEIPTFRLDISLPEDLIEEIGRISGWEKIPAKFPVVSLIPPKRNFNIFWEDKTKNTLKELGFTEVYNYSFISEKQRKTTGFREKELLEIENPVSGDYRYLRPSLIPNLLKNAESNLRFYKKIKIFELGSIFFINQGQKKEERKALSGLIVQDQKKDGFYELKGVIDSLFGKLGISNVWYDNFQQTPEQSKQIIWDFDQSAEIKTGEQEIGFLGGICFETLKELKIKNQIFLFDIDFEKLEKICSEETEYRPISQYPSAVRDIAVLVPLDVKVADILNEINIAGGKLVSDVDLFDIYEGKELPQGRKNLAFHIIYQAEDRTLSSREIDSLQQKIIKSLEKNITWQVRK